MIKRTLYFGNPAYLSTSNEQLVINLPEAEADTPSKASIPIEDVGVVILDNFRITITQASIEHLLANNVALISCNSKHHPTGLMLNLDGNTLQQERWENQLSASEPLRKQLWQQTVQQKICNQAHLLHLKGVAVKNMKHWESEVHSGDTMNHEARAAAYYWANIFPDELCFRRGRDEAPPNNLLNYGYAILRAITARSLVASGMLPTVGIHHHNRYNSYCLADDIMEPYRPFVDMVVLSIVNNGEDYRELNKSIKTELLQIPTIDVVINGRRSPLMIALQQTTASLAKCFDKQIRKISYPEFPE
jgi:CRISP-associated protein Cas1